MLSLVGFNETEHIVGGIHFSLPGDYHHAMWMWNGICGLKIFGFREQLKMNAHELCCCRL